mmetsp:Transcript_9613/g.16511  ORF Transcript_9613/g.16511 Transcript_9613/m.16511 type:complete len:302 (+) Transcript_9613:807-1712(+)
MGKSTTPHTLGNTEAVAVGEKSVRRVCKEWQEAHDSMVSSLRLKAPLLLPYRLRTTTGFTAVNELDMSSACGDPAMSRLVESALGSLSGLRSLNLAHNKVDLLRLTTVGPSLTGLTYLSLALTNTSDALLARMTPFLPSLTDLDLQECTRVTFAPRYQPRLLASLTSLTRLNLGCTKVDDEGMQALAPLTALTHLSLFGTHVSAEGLDLLAPFAAHLTHLVLGGVRGEEGDIYGDPEMIAVSSLTALTHLEMRYSGGGDFVSEEGLEALSSLTGLLHLELDLRHFDNGDEGPVLPHCRFLP